MACKQGNDGTNSNAERLNKNHLNNTLLSLSTLQHHCERHYLHLPEFSNLYGDWLLSAHLQNLGEDNSSAYYSVRLFNY